MQTPRPRPGRPPPGAGRGETPPGPPPAWTPPLHAGAAADSAPGGHRREAGTAGHGRGSAAGDGGSDRARAARPGHTLRGAGGGRDVGKRGGQSPAFRALGDFCLSHTRLSLQLPNLINEEAGTPACWGGRGVWGLGRRPPPHPVWLAGE